MLVKIKQQQQRKSNKNWKKFNEVVTLNKNLFNKSSNKENLLGGA